jgi:hypothetical protein
MRKAFGGFANVVGGNRRQHAAGYAPIERFRNLEADRPQARYCYSQRASWCGVLAFGWGNIFHLVKLKPYRD